MFFLYVFDCGFYPKLVLSIFRHLGTTFGVWSALDNMNITKQYLPCHIPHACALYMLVF